MVFENGVETGLCENGERVFEKKKKKSVWHSLDLSKSDRINVPSFRRNEPQLASRVVDGRVWSGVSLPQR